MRFVVVGQGRICVEAAFDRGAEEPHGRFGGILRRSDSVGVAVAHHELRPWVSQPGGAEVPFERGGFVRIGPFSDRKPLPKLEAGLHVPCLGLGNQLL